MKLAITSDASDLASPVAPRFGRAKCFIVYDLDSGEVEAMDNSQNLEAVQGVGIQAARNIVDAGVRAVITGNVGPKAFAALQAANVSVYLEAAATVGEAIERYKAGELKPTDGANVEGHWT